MLEIIKELKTIEGDTMVGILIFIGVITYITLNGIAAIVRAFKNK